MFKDYDEGRDGWTYWVELRLFGRLVLKVRLPYSVWKRLRLRSFWD